MNIFTDPKKLALLNAGVNMLAASRGGNPDLTKGGLGYGLQQGLLGAAQGYQMGQQFSDKGIQDKQRDRIMGLIGRDASVPEDGMGPVRPAGILMDASPAEQEFARALASQGQFDKVADYAARMNKTEGSTALMKNAVAMGLTPGTPEYNEFIRNAVMKPSSQISLGDNVQVKGDYAITRNPDGSVNAKVIPGTETWFKQKDAEGKKGQVEERQKGTAQTQVRSIEEAKKIIKDSPVLSSGFLGNYMKNLGGTSAANLDAYLNTIEANISFDYLQAMRNSSPTGGALGNVSEKELALLGSTAASVKQSQSSDQLMKNLEILERQFLEVIHGKDAADEIIKSRIDSKKAPEDASTDDLVEMYTNGN
jgi:hypothetical protein